MAEWRTIGEVALLQIQRRRLVTGEPPTRRYDPAPLLETDALAVTTAGPLAAIDGGWSLDVHHGAHPENTRYLPNRALSIGFTSHYAEMAERFGDAKLGVAGENIIVETAARVMPADIAGGVRIETTDGDLTIGEARVANPCHPFTKYLLGRPDAASEDVEDDRDALRYGIRGYVMRVDGLAATAIVRPGDRVAIRPG